MGLSHADLAVERVALALKADGRGEHQARYGDDGQDTAAEHDVEGSLHNPVDKARAVPVHDGLHGLVTADALAPVHGLSNQCRSRRRTALCYFFSSHSQKYIPVPQGSPNR